MTKANSTHISLETAKLLKSCSVKSQFLLIPNAYQLRHEQTAQGKYIISTEKKNQLGERLIRRDTVAAIMGEAFPAYTWQEILWEHAEEFFGNAMIHNEYASDDWQFVGEGCFSFSERAYFRHSRIIAILLLKKKYDEADYYFRKHCILIPQPSND